MDENAFEHTTKTPTAETSAAAEHLSVGTEADAQTVQQPTPPPAKTTPAAETALPQPDTAEAASANVPQPSCKTCGTVFEPQQKFCAKCGAPRPVTPAPAGTKPICKTCGAAFEPQQKFCAQCGAPRPAVRVWERVCSKCGTTFARGSTFCANCGTKRQIIVQGAATPPQNAPDKAAAKKKIIIVSVILFSLIVICVIIGIILGSHNRSDAQVPQQSQTGTSSQKASQINFRDAVKNITVGSTYYTIASDGSYLEFDTNPYDIDDYYNENAWNSVLKINEALGLPKSLEAEMSKTRALDGMITRTYEKITVSWTYHPDHGLEITYSLVP